MSRYDRAIDFLRASFKLVDSGPGGRGAVDPRTLSRMDKMRRDLVKLNNHALYKHKAAVGKGWKTHM